MVTDLRAIAPPAFLAIVVGLLFGTAVSYGFAYDDLSIIQSNGSIGDWATIWNALTHDLFHNTDVRASPFWRPLVTLSYYVDRSVSDSPSVGHIVNLFWVWVLAVGVYRFLVSSGASNLMAIAAAVFLICYPTLVEPAVNITSRTDLLALALGLLAINSERSRWILFWTLLALFSKEVAIVLPVMFLALGKRTGARASFLGVGVYLVARAAVMLGGGLGEVAFSHRDMIEAGAVFWLQFAYTVAPCLSTIGGSIPDIEPIATLAGWLGIIAVIAFLVLRWSATPVLARLGLVILVPSLLLASGITGNQPRVGDGLLLFPTFGALCCLLGVTYRLKVEVRILGLFILSVASITLTRGDIDSWRNDATLWNYAYAQSPRDSLIALNYSRTIVDVQPELVPSILMDLKFEDPRKQREASEVIARAHIQLGEDVLAIPYLLKALGDDVESKWANSTACLLVSGQLAPEAESVCRLAFTTDPLDGGLHNALGVYFGRLGEPSAAIPHFEAAVSLAPENTSYGANLRSAMSSVGQDLIEE